MRIFIVCLCFCFAIFKADAFPIFVSKQMSFSKDTIPPNAALKALFENYSRQRMQFFPLESTQNGDTAYNHLLTIDFTPSFAAKLKPFYTDFLRQLNQFSPNTLNENDQLSFAIFKYNLEMDLAELGFSTEYIPFQQFEGLPLLMGQLGSGKGFQPFKTLKDYENWIERATLFNQWADSAITYFRKGIENNYVLPKKLVEKMIPQMEAMLVDEATKSLFYQPIQELPQNLLPYKAKLETAYQTMISQSLVPAYKKLYNFLKNEYLPKARNSSGINALPQGEAYYNYLIKSWTTTNLSPTEIYNLGLKEVARIEKLMLAVKNEVGFKGSLPEFFEAMKNDTALMPYKTAEEILNAFQQIQQKIDPELKKYFGLNPKTPFEIRQTEAFRAATASAEYNQGSPDGTRPGIFYIPILDAKNFNITSGMESLFLHEAIPGHHYQISLQQENTELPDFRRFGWYGAYGEGWALYTESLGKQLGCYTNPYQYIGALSDEMHRAIRLVVDVGIHTGKMTREEAIEYMVQREPISEAAATAEIERYMAIPAQALSYKIGALKIAELRDKYQQQLGKKFSITEFHDNFLKDGGMPLEIIEIKLNNWAKSK